MSFCISITLLLSIRCHPERSNSRKARIAESKDLLNYQRSFDSVLLSFVEKNFAQDNIFNVNHFKVIYTISVSIALAISKSFSVMPLAECVESMTFTFLYPDKRRSG